MDTEPILAMLERREAEALTKMQAAKRRLAEVIEDPAKRDGQVNSKPHVPMVSRVAEASADLVWAIGAYHEARSLFSDALRVADKVAQNA